MERVITNLDNFTFLNEEDGNYENNTTDSINHKFSLVSIVISFFIIFNVLLMNMESKSEKITDNPFEIGDNSKIIKDFFLEKDYTYETNNHNERYLQENFYSKILLDIEEDEYFKKNISYFFKNVSSNIYEGTWSSDLPIINFQSLSGDVKINLNTALSLYTNETLLIFSFKLLENQNIDNWYLGRANKGFSSILDPNLNIFDFNSNSLKFENFTLYISYGKLFDKEGPTYECNSNINIKWDYKMNGLKPIINRVRGNLMSENCEIPLEIKFATEIENPSKNNLDYVYYSLMVTLLCLTQNFSTIWLNQKIQDSTANSNAISLFSVGQNIIWNSYGCLCHFFLAVNDEEYISHFGIPAFFFFANFSIFELRLLYNVWKNQNIHELNDINVIRKKLVKFYITFYIFLFMSLFFVTKFYFEHTYILIAVCVTWTPQIIYNFIYNNQTSMPLINIFLNSFNKVLIPFYFRGYSQNIFNIKTDLNLVYLCSAILLAQITILYLQILCGPRFFVPCKFTRNEHKFYRSKEEILSIKKELEFAECAICLFSLFSLESIRKLEQSNQNDFFEENQPQQNKCRKFLIKIYNIIFDFHEYHIFSKKPFIMTQCNHVFHSDCLENWLKLKRECPTDRTHIPPIIY